MSAISERLPSRLPRGRLGRIGPLNVLLAAGVVALAVVAYLTIGTSKSATPTVRTATAARGVVLSTVSATGTLQSPAQVAVGFTSSGTLISVKVHEGEHVNRGQVLGRIDPTTASQSLRQAEMAYALANAQYAQTVAGETPQQRRQDALSVTQAKQSIVNANGSLAAAERTVALDKRTSAASVAQAQQQLRVDQGQEQIDLAQQKTDQGTYATVDAANAAVAADKAQLATDQSKQQSDQLAQLNAQHQQSEDQASLATAKADNNTSAIDTYTSAVNQDTNTLNVLQVTLQQDGFAITADQSRLSADQASASALTADSKAIRGDESKIASDHTQIASAKTNQDSTSQRDQQSLVSARQQIASAKLGLNSTLAGNAVKQAPPTAAVLDSSRASVMQAGINLANARKVLAETTARAPIDGVVASVNGTVGTTVSGGGNSTVSSSSSSSGTGSGGSGGSSGFVTLTQLSGMQVLASFSETDAAKLRVGQPATVTVDAEPNNELAAHVIAISPIASTSSSVVTYDVTFAVDRSAPQLKPGMTANVDVVTAESDNVVHVPTAAVNGSGANATVTVLRNGKQTRIAVVAGLQGDSSTAILSGLKSGDAVVLPSVSIAATSGTGTGLGGTSTTSGTSGTLSGGGGRGFGGGGFGGGGFGG